MRTRQSKLPEFDEELDFLEEIDECEED